jgi:hypothetical protein
MTLIAGIFFEDRGEAEVLREVNMDAMRGAGKGSFAIIGQN